MEDFLRLKDINFQRLNHTEFCFFVSHVVDYMFQYGFEALHLPEEDFDKFKSDVERISDLLNESLSSMETPKIQGLLHAQRRLFSHIRTTCKSSLSILSDNDYLVASEVYSYLKQNSRIYELPQYQLLQIIDSLLVHLSNESFAQYIEQLNFTPIIRTLSENNAEIRRLLDLRAIQTTRLEQDKTQTLRMDLIKQYTRLTTYIWAQSVVKPSEELHAFVCKLNKLISDIYEAYRRRMAQSRRGKKSREQGDANTEVSEQ